ncbi:hypothetical protein [Myxococcus sp. RHSTA-1-4]|uniref:hypothetical protein n=1 Tax=Myxococcus sp. RHSTA-1-4 TaxID=2874601 RepID=UPI001CC1242C|nr:hypothetical protein [Myxococcus sp. RHSTA-1-4]MBZ4420983.1 hypothetical protein [Myxococcus sp. RHSTA-1-4]
MRRNLQRAAMLAGMLAAGGVMAQAVKNFTLDNKIGVTLARVYISPTLDNDWGQDVLGRDVLRHGEYAPIVFSPLNQLCVYDIKVEDISSNELVWSGIDLCEVSVVTLLYDPVSGEGFADTR